MLSMSRLSREYVFLDVQTPNNLSSSTTEVAFMSQPQDIPTTGDWENATLLDEGGWRIRILIGPGHQDSVELSPGDYQVWAKIIDYPEQPVRRVGVLEIE